MRAGREARRAVSRAENSKALTTIARIGFAGSGLMHLLMGYLAIRVAYHRGGESDQSGAFAQMMKLPGGMVLLWITVVGLAALALLLLLQAALGIGSSSKKRWIRSLVSFGKGVAYAALTSTALALALRKPANSSTTAQHASGTLLSLPGGQGLLIAVGIATAGIGVYFIYKGALKKFHEDISVPTGRFKHAVDGLAMTGYIAKGIAIVALGVLLVVAAIHVDPQDATGLDGALKALTALPLGGAILVMIGIGLIAYGIYSFVRAKLARL